jgi:hypothetical protein
MSIPFSFYAESWKQLGGQVRWSWPPDPQNGACGFLLPLTLERPTLVPDRMVLRGGVFAPLTGMAVTFQLELSRPGQRRREPLMRIDWRPKSPVHRNPDRALIEDTHFHPFEANWLKSESRMRKGNLPWAEPVTGLIDFPRVLAFVRAKFRIRDVEQIPSPPWIRQ